ncbi:tape_meas_TP901, phage tail tape measure protein, TP901 family, core region [uncultured Caudovirales phage]|uniref:Tape_meas_TP901, phage tail tape measure protein, TP901 family, core region n=1 Tax=uncultured Caudovirales phage TaxID=2100421 RepID=A0A6J5M5H9_9CAUD|nr:tape_meas_TP901, phage tail tape measure protein, TP901 family, core region [uncultured Caudovirales phage]
MATVRELVTKLSFKAETNPVKDFIGLLAKAANFLDNLGKKSGEAEKGLDNVSKKAKNAKKPLSDINEDAKNAGMGLSALNLGLAGASLAFVGFATNAVKSFGDLEHVFNTIRAVAPEVTPRMKEIEKSVMDLGASTTFSSLEVAKAYEELAKKGFTAQQMLETMPGLLDASMASGEDLAKVADIVTSSIQQFNLKTSQSGEVADLLTQGANTSSASILSLGDGLIYAGANGRAYNQTLKEMVTSLAVLNNAGVKAGDAGSDIAALLANFNAIAVGRTPKLTELRHTIKKLGVTIIDSKGKMLPFLDIIQNLGKATKKWSDAKRNGLALDIAGKENQKTLNLIMGMSKEKIDAVRKSMDEASGSSKKASDIMKEGLNPTMEKLGGATDAFNVEVGKMFAPATIAGLKLLTEIMNGLGNAAKWMNETPAFMDTIGKGFTGEDTSSLNVSAIKKQRIYEAIQRRKKEGATSRDLLNEGYSATDLSAMGFGAVKQGVQRENPLKNPLYGFPQTGFGTKGGGVTINQNNTFNGNSATKGEQKQTARMVHPATGNAVGTAIQKRSVGN